MQRVANLLCMVLMLFPAITNSNYLDDQFALDHWPDRIIVKFAPAAMPIYLHETQLITNDDKLSSALYPYVILEVRSLCVSCIQDDLSNPPELQGLYLLLFETGSDYLEALDILHRSPAVIYAELDLKVYPLETPSDTSYDEQWGMEKIMAPNAWDLAHGVPSVCIAILDSGMDLTHSDLSANFWINNDEMVNGIDDDANGYIDDTNGWDFLDHDAAADDDVRCNHGTHVGGIASAVTNNALGVAGVAWNCKLMNLRIMGWSAGMQTCVGSVSDSLLGIQYAVANGADVINMSIGHTGQASAERDTVNWAYGQGLLLVGAAGNGGSDGIGDPAPDYPGGYEVVICVGNSNRNDRKDSSSNYGVGVDVFAPGSRIYSTYKPNTYSNAAGTSMASPHVAGLVGLMVAAGVTDKTEIRTRIEHGAENIDAVNPEYAGQLGYGRINAWYSIIPNSLVRPISLAIADQNGDDDAQADSGERVALVFTFKNQSWRDATATTATITDAGSYASIVQNTSPIGDLPNKAEGINTSPLILDIAPDAPENSTITVTMSIGAADWTHTETFTFSLNDPRPPMKGWPKIGISNSFNSSPVFADLDDDGAREVILCDNAAQVFVWRHDGSGYPGWPVTLPDSDAHISLGTPAIGDLEGDGALEIIVASFRTADPNADPPVEAQGKLFVYAIDGTLKSGWPLTLTQEIKTSPTIFDLDGNNDLEIIFGSYDNNLYVYHHDGVSMSNWPVNVGADIFSSPAVADLDRDGSIEIVVGVKDDSEVPTYGKILVFDPAGNVKTGFPVDTPGQVYPSCALADLDLNGDLEIVTGCGNYAGGDPAASKMYALHHDGSPVDGWPIDLPDTVYGSPALGDLDGNGDIEIVIGCYDAKVYAWHSDGQPVAGWPITTGDQIFSSPVIADLEGDGAAEVFIGSYDGNFYGLRYDGTSLIGYPIPIGVSIFASPAIADLDGDTDLEIAVADSAGSVYIWNDPIKADRDSEWGKFRNTLENTGLYSRRASHPPSIILVGYWDSWIDLNSGGMLQIIAAVIDTDGTDDIADVELYFDGIPTGVKLLDDGSQGDFSAGDGVFGLKLGIGSGGVPEGRYLLELKATDLAGNSSWLAPYLEVN